MLNDRELFTLAWRVARVEARLDATETWPGDPLLGASRAPRVAICRQSFGRPFARECIALAAGLLADRGAQ